MTSWPRARLRGHSRRQWSPPPRPSAAARARAPASAARGGGGPQGGRLRRRAGPSPGFARPLPAPGCTPLGELHGAPPPPLARPLQARAAARIINLICLYLFIYRVPLCGPGRCWTHGSPTRLSLRRAVINHTGLGFGFLKCIPAHTFGNRLSLCAAELGDAPPSASSRALGLQACVTTPGWQSKFYSSPNALQVCCFGASNPCYAPLPCPAPVLQRGTPQRVPLQRVRWPSSPTQGVICTVKAKRTTIPRMTRTVRAPPTPGQLGRGRGEGQLCLPECPARAAYRES